jgi:hypothetical protein
MPLQRCELKGGKKGWKWGKSGTCYSTKEGARKQMRAIYASGYKGGTRKSRRHS